jgi:FkbM family methyltransferase
VCLLQFLRRTEPSDRAVTTCADDIMVRRAQLLLLLSPFARLYPAVRRIWQISRYVLRRPVTHGGDFAGLGRLVDTDGLFLDVGASSGTSAMSFRVFNRRSPILSIEPNRVLEPELRFLKRIVRRFDYLIAAAGDRHDTVSIYVPWYKGVPLTAYSSANREDLVSEGSGLRDWLGERVASRHLRIQEVTSPMFPLDDLELSPAAIKIDVEGSELHVLRGLSGTLERTHPILLIERSRDFDEIRRLLHDRGYSAYCYRPDSETFVSFGRVCEGPNVFFLLEAPPPRGTDDG